MCNSPPIVKKQACISIQGWRGCVQNWTRSKNSGWTSRKCELSHSWLNFGRILAPISTRRVGSGQPGTIPSAPSRLPSSPVRFQWLQPATRDRILPRYQSRCYQSERIPLDSFVSIISIFRLGEGETRKLEYEYLADDSLSLFGSSRVRSIFPPNRGVRVDPCYFFLFFYWNLSPTNSIASRKFLQSVLLIHAGLCASIRFQRWSLYNLSRE